MSTDTVLFLTYWYPHRNNKMAGIFVKKHAHAISIQCNLIVLAINITKGKGIYKKQVTVFKDERNVETHQIVVESRFYKLFYLMLPWQYLLLKKYIEKNLLPEKQIRIIHSNILFPCAVVGYWLAKKFDYKFVITEHWSKINKFFRVSLYSRWGKRAYNKADAITCVSGQLAATVKKHSTNPKILIVPNIIDSKEFYFDPTIQKNETFTFIAVAHWGREKNPFYFLEALNQLSQENNLSNFKVTIVGEGEKIQLIKNGKYDFELDFKSELNSKEICRELNASHIFLHGSDFETFSVIIAEALMCGLPSVVSPVGISAEVINSKNGLIAKNDVADWKEKIMICYNTKYDNKLISQQLKGKYDAETVGKLFNDIYKNL